ncbi:kinase-like protein [Aureobasidium pullulans EXF-150]|uniref:Kinase-like protein n=1 Tax=Aureobasidium pullulans EXF-150 TaxID=1043002 RepID=A0A074XKK1_AURPU|nr:kinase-like protein [Aureobasidium pullulans EXF-150]KEQ86035.1 kinase-like protein [Aureobasidium pullulans EXF-150]
MSLTFAESETTSLPLLDFDDTTPGDDPVIGTVGEAIEASKTRARSGKYPSSLSELVTLLAELGANGPIHLRNLNIGDCGIRVGHGNQFDVFRQVDHVPGYALQKVVYKRVKFRPKQTDSDSAVNREYRRTLRYLQLEVISLCHPRLRNHRNIVKLLSWAYDYPDRKTPIPVLVMEAALFPLSEMLKDSQRHLDTLIAVSHWDIRHHIALDVAAGVEALHSSEIIHGDIKPANVLTFRQDNPSVPFLAKLSDFGVCIDMSDHKIGARDYFGTSKCPKP